MAQVDGGNFTIPSQFFSYNVGTVNEQTFTYTGTGTLVDGILTVSWTYVETDLYDSWTDNCVVTANR